MKIIVAPDSYKGSLTAEQAAEAMKRGIIHALGSDTVCQIDLVPMSDGGEGFTESIVAAQKGTTVRRSIRSEGR